MESNKSPPSTLLLFACSRFTRPGLAGAVQSVNKSIEFNWGILQIIVDVSIKKITCEGFPPSPRMYAGMTYFCV